MLPCRGVAEHAYCPRLFYYMTVEGVFLPRADTEKGAGVHRRVDRPSLAPGTLDEDGDRPRAVRSLALSSERLGLTGKLDLVEIEADRAVPVEYRKGRPRRCGEPTEPRDEMLEQPSLPLGLEPWPTDRVQVGLQVLLLEDAGYEVPEAYLYYDTERIRLRIEVDEALRRSAQEELDAARATASRSRPDPLVNSPKCKGCSLQPICLPDELHSLRQHESGTSARPRRMWPPRDEGIHLVAQREGVKVGVRGQSVRFTDKDGSLVREFPLANLQSLAVLSSVQVSTQALSIFADHEIPVAFLTAAGRLTAMMDPMGPTSASVRTAQVRELDRPERALDLARAVVVAKIANQRTLLMRNHVDLPQRVADDLERCLRAAERAVSMDVLRGHEGQAAAVYFEHFSGVFKEGVRSVADRFLANGRKRRPPPDPVNAVLSFGYAMLVNECVAACRLASLEPGMGALHSTRPGRPGLALDLMEPFRPLIADSVAISGFNRGELVEGHFLDTAAGCALTDPGRKAFFSAYGRRMDTEVTHSVFDYRLSYRRMLMLHARLVAAWLQGEVPDLAFLTTR